MGYADGTGAAATFNSPMGIGADGSGYVYVADTGNSTIRKINDTTGAVTTIAGMALTNAFADGPASAARFFAPRGVVFGGGALYILDSGNHILRKLQP